MAARHVELRVAGRVQGVFYRGSTQEKAQSLGLVGTVENLQDGSVLVFAEGDEAQLEELITWCRTGPGAAKVDHLTVRFSEVSGEFSEFKILR